MLRESVERDLRDRHLSDGYFFPSYGDYCFANVPDTVLDLLGAGARRPLPADVFDGVETDVENVVVLLVDGYGYEQWTRDHRDHGLLTELTERGTVTPLTSIYPSETAAAITTVHTGRQPVEHGLLGWFQYHEGVGDLVQTLPFATLDGRPITETDPTADASWLFDTGAPTVYERAADRDVTSTVVMPAEITGPPHSEPALRGAEILGYDGLDGMARRVRERVENADGPTYTYGYVPHVDAVAHEHGTESERYQEQLAAVLSSVRRELVDALDAETAERTLLLVTADHGHVNTVPEENVALGSLDGVTEHLRRGPDGDPLPVCGSPRNLQFHVRDGHVEALRESLTSQLDCLTLSREEFRARDLFGDAAPSERFAAREPDLVATHRNRGVWYDDELGELDLVGMHGGLHPDEMLVPFAAARLSRLR